MHPRPVRLIKFAGLCHVSWELYQKNCIKNSVTVDGLQSWYADIVASKSDYSASKRYQSSDRSPRMV